MDDQSPSMLKPTLIGGGLFGLLGAIPFVSMLNCACCALVMGGGFFAAYLYSKECSGQGAAFRPGSGAVVGLVAGMFYAITNAVLGWLFSQITTPPDIDEIIDQMEAADLPPEAIDSAVRFFEMFMSPFGVVIMFFVLLLAGAIFSTLGGLIGGAVFKVEPAPPAPPMVSTPPTGGETP